MRGLMQESPLVVTTILDHAARFHGEQASWVLLLCSMVERMHMAWLPEWLTMRDSPARPTAIAVLCPTPTQVVVSVGVEERSVEVSSWRQVAERARLCALALRRLGIRCGPCASPDMC